MTGSHGAAERRPRADAATRVLDFAMDIDPLPTVRAENLDIEGNLVAMTWFHGATTHLDIRTRATVDTLVTDPFRFLIAVTAVHCQPR